MNDDWHTLRFAAVRSLTVIALALSLFFAAPVHADVVAILPPRAPTPELTRLGFLIEARALSALTASKSVATLDTKQVLAMASQEGLDPAALEADAARALLGADRVVSVNLAVEADTLTLSGEVRDAKSTPFSLTVKGGPAAWLSGGGDGLAKTLLGTDAQLGALQPNSTKDAAVTALATCWDVALHQPMGLDAPVGLAATELELAISSCRAALKADPSLRFAQATLALLLAIARNDTEANTLLGPASSTDSALMPWALSRFWLATRSQSNQAAVAFLSSVLANHPGALVLRSFRANTLAAMNQHDDAIAAWDEYLAMAPRSAFALGRKARSLARREQPALAVAAAKKAVEAAPSSREAKVVLAARLIDSGSLAEAKRTLEPLIKSNTGTAEPLLQLATATAHTDCAAAMPLFTSAIERAVGPRAPRQKGRALSGLAWCEAKLGHADAAKKAWADSVATGFHTAPEAPLAELIGPAPAAATQTLYIHLDSVAETAAPTLRTRLETLGAAFAPDKEDKKAAQQTLTTKKLKGYELRLSLEPGDAPNAMKVQLVVSSYPERALKGSWMVKASGGKPEKVIPLIVSRVVDDAAGDLEWK